jgi:hypothetical protein
MDAQGCRMAGDEPLSAMNFAVSRILPTGLLMAAAVIAVHGQGTIVYHNPQDIPLFTVGSEKSYDLDLDSNGVTDYRVVVTGGTFAAHGTGNNASLTTPEQPPSLGVYILPLFAGEYIGPSLTPASIWFETYLYEPVPGQIFEIPAYFHGCTTAGCGADPFHEITAYWGVQFEIEGNLHYGWVQVETPQLSPNIFVGGTILDWAYNATPGQPILAGQVPEPGTWALLSAGLGFLGWRFRRVRLST